MSFIHSRSVQSHTVRRNTGFAAISIAGLLIALTSAQAEPAAEPRNVVQLSASGTLEVPQDWLTLTLTATKEGADASAVQSYLRQVTETAIAEIRKSVQPGSMEVRTGGFSLQPRYGNDGKINGWLGSSELVLEGSDFSRIGATATKVAHMAVGGLGFSLSRQARTQLESQAQALAIESFKAKAGDIAHAFGFKDYALREVTVSATDQSPFPRPRMMAMATRAAVAEAAPLPMESGKSLVVVTVSGAVQLIK